MSPTEPRIFRMYFFNRLDYLDRAVEEVERTLRLDTLKDLPEKDFYSFTLEQLEMVSKKVLKLDTGVTDMITLSQDYLKGLAKQLVPTEKQREKRSEGIFSLAVALKSNSPDVVQGWCELEDKLPANLPNGLLKPITVYHAVSGKEVMAQDEIGCILHHQSLSPTLEFAAGRKEETARLLGGSQMTPKKAPLHCGNLYQLGSYEECYLFFSRENELEARNFTVQSLPLLNIYSYSGDMNIQDREERLPAARSHMKEVSEKIRNKLNEYSSKGFGSITTEAERKDIFEITKDLWLLNNNASQMLNLIETVNMALSNFKNLKERLLAPGEDEIFCQKERLLELQKAQLQANATYLQNIFESGRVVLDSIEDHMELEYTRELKESNKKALSLQSAAFIIEFAIVFYYFLGSWHYILGEKFYEFPPFARLLCATSVASLLSAGTHLFAKWRLTKKWYYFYWLLGLLPILLFTFGYIVTYSILLHK